MMSSEEDYKSNSNELPLLIYRNKTEEFKILKNKYLSNNKNGEDLIIIKFKQAALNISTVLNTDSLEINKMVHNCCICGSKFGKIFNKKQKCLVCNSIVCSSCNTNHIPLSSLNIISPNSINSNNHNHNSNQHGQQQQSVQTCNVCFNSLGIIIKRFEFIKLNEIACNSDFVTFYEQMQLNIMDLKKNLPNFKSMILQIQNSASPLASKAKQLEQTISLHIKELESGIRQLKQLQGSTPKQNQVINNIKHSFATYLQTSIPEFKIASSNLTQKLSIKVDTTNSIIKSSQNSPSQSHQSPLSSSPSSSSNASYTNISKPLLKTVNNELQIDEPLLNSLSLKELNDEIRNRGFSTGDYRNKADVLKQLTDILNTEIYNIEIGDNSGNKNNIQITKLVDNSTVSSSPPLFSSFFNSFSNLLNDKKSQPPVQQPAQSTYQPITEAGEAKFENGTLTINGRLLTSLSLKEMNDEIRIRGLAIPKEMRNKPDVYLLLRDVLMDEIQNKSNVTSVVPAVCPQSGSFITITGENLNKKSIEIKVGSVKVAPFKQNVNAIMFLSPSQPQEGEVELIISDGPNHILAKQFLFFTNSCFTTEDDISNVNDYALDMFQKSTTSPLLNSSSESSSSNNNSINIQSPQQPQSNNNSIKKQHNRMSSSPSSSNNNSPTLKPQINNNNINSNGNSPILKSVNNSNNNNNNDSFSILMSKEIGSTGKSFDDLIVEMIHPTVSPLSGTKVSVQFKNPIKSTIQVFLDSGIQIQNLEVSNAGNKLSFKTPPLSQGSHSIEFIQDSKRLYLDSILFYDSSISQQPSIQQFGNSGFNNNNYNNNNNNNFMYQKEQPKIVTSSRVLGGKRN